MTTETMIRINGVYLPMDMLDMLADIRVGPATVKGTIPISTLQGPAFEIVQVGDGAPAVHGPGADRLHFPLPDPGMTR